MVNIFMYITKTFYMPRGRKGVVGKFALFMKLIIYFSDIINP